MANRRKTNNRGAFALSTVSLWVATVILAAFGAVGWALALWGVSQPLAVMGATVALVAPLVAASLSGPAMRGGGFYAWLAIIVFTLMDAGSNANAAWQFDAAANASVNAEASDTYAAEYAAAVSAREAARAKLAALPTPDATGAIRKAETYAVTAGILAANVATADAAVTGLVKPQPARLFPKEASGAVMGLTSLALILGHLGIARAQRKQEAPKASKPRATNSRPATRKKPAASKPKAPSVGGNVLKFPAPPKPRK